MLIGLFASFALGAFLTGRLLGRSSGVSPVFGTLAPLLGGGLGLGVFALGWSILR